MTYGFLLLAIVLLVASEFVYTEDGAYTELWGKLIHAGLLAAAGACMAVAMVRML